MSSKSPAKYPTNSATHLRTESPSMLRRALTASALPMLVMGLSPGSTFAQRAKKLVYANPVPATFTLSMMDKWFMDEVSKRSAGRLTFETYYAGALLNSADLYPGLSRGAADIVTNTPSAYSPAEYPLSSITLPYITSDVEAATKAFNDLYRSSPELKAEYAKQNVLMLYSYGAMENTLWTHKQVNDLNDLKGLRVRAVLGVGEAFSQLGATPVAMGIGDSLEGFKRKAIDALSSMPFDIAMGLGLPKVAPFVSDAGGMGVYAMYTTAINKKTFEALGAADQKIVLEVANEVPTRYLGLINTMQDDAVKAAVGTGLKAYKVPDAEANKWRSIVSNVSHKAWISKANAAGYDGGALLQKYIDLVRKYEATSKYRTGVSKLMAKS